MIGWAPMTEDQAQLHADLYARLQAIYQRIEQAARLAGRTPSSIELVAVSKTQSLTCVRALYQLGQHSFGENYVQELLVKAAACRDLDIRWVFIGALQSNKIAKLVAVAAEIQTVASLKHAELIALAARQQQKSPYPIYIAVNADPLTEPQKNGLHAADLPDFLQAIKPWQRELAVQGVMAVPPPLTAVDLTPGSVPTPLYQSLRALARQVGDGKLSLGMSQDLEMAIAVGSTCVRIGSALMGERGNRKST